MTVKRIDSCGRDVTDLPGLWDESDRIIAVDVERWSAVKSLQAIVKLANRIRLAIALTTWDGRKWARWEAEQHFCMTLPQAWRTAGIVWK